MTIHNYSSIRQLLIRYTIIILPTKCNDYIYVPHSAGLSSLSHLVTEAVLTEAQMNGVRPALVLLYNEQSTVQLHV